MNATSEAVEGWLDRIAWRHDIVGAFASASETFDEPAIDGMAET